jgi:hypothetical protein
MSKLSELINENKECVQELRIAQNNLIDNLKTLDNVLGPVFEKYKECFEDLKSESENIGASFPEIYKDDFGNWGNRGLIRITYEANGFATLHTKDYFRNETDYFEAYLPQKYLEDNALELIEKDAERIKVELEAIKLSQELNQKNNFRESKKIKI